MAVMGGWEIFTRNGGKPWMGEVGFIMNPYFMKMPPYPYCLPLPLFQILSTLCPPSPHPFTLPCHLQPPKLTILSVVLSLVLFLWLNGWSRDIWCTVLLNDNMDLQMSSLGALVSEGPWCVLCNTVTSLLSSDT